MHLLLVALIATSSLATTTTLVNDIGDPYYFVHTSGDPLWITPASTGVLRVCLVLTNTHQCVQYNQYSSRCNIITSNCRCYTWMNTNSDQQCVDLPYSPSTTILETQWQLLQRPSVYAAPSAIASFYTILHDRFPAYSFIDYLNAVCPLQDTPSTIPPPCIVEHTIPLQRMPAAPIVLRDLSQAIAVACALVILIPLTLSYVTLTPTT